MTRCNKHPLEYLRMKQGKNKHKLPNHYLLRFLFSLAIHVMASKNVEI